VRRAPAQTAFQISAELWLEWISSPLLGKKLFRLETWLALLKIIAPDEREAYRMTLMNKCKRNPEEILKRLGEVHWNKAQDAFVVETEFGALLQLCPNSDEDIAAGVHVDEISVPESYRGRRAATKALAALCRLADEQRIVLKGGPIGWSEDPWSNRFVAWLSRFGVKRDPSPPTQVHDRTAFYARRLPRPLR